MAKVELISMSSFDWNNIISFNGSQNNAFEELVCQLAREEDIADKVSFDRIGTPDGGVEAYYTLRNGDEYGWQAKFFDSMGQSQWRQLEDSFKNAFEKHPRLAKYYICIPLDRADPKIENKKWFMDKWKEKIEQWQQYAREKRRSIEFEYWGSSELLHKISLEKHAGRRKFWINEIDLSNQWFADQTQRSIDDLGRRYTKERNFELSIAKTFDFIARDEHFQEHIYDAYDEALKKLSKCVKAANDKDLSQYRTDLQQDLTQLQKTYESTKYKEMMPVDFDCILSSVTSTQKHCESLDCHIDNWRKSKEQHTKDEPADRFNYLLHLLREAQNSLYDFREFITDPKMMLVNVPHLILQGNAGIGKSHLLADVVLKRTKENKQSILLLGQHFVNNESPWTQILRNILRLNCNEDEFLGALDAKAQAMGSRIIVFIDALNEGKGPYFWQDHIKGFVNSFKKYKWIGLVLSIRSSYVKKIVPQELITNDMAVRIEHYGFRDVEYEASKYFFNQYGIVQPSIPLLNPDFQNPLYLIMFCEGLKRKKISVIPDGYEGITSVINLYLENINDSLSRRFNYPDNLNLVRMAAELIAEKKVEKNLDLVFYKEAYDLIETEFRNYLNERGFLDALISEGIFIKNLYWNENDQSSEVIRFTYQKFEEHVTASCLLKKHLNPANPEEAFSEGQILYELIKTENDCYNRYGVIEAITIQLPELIGKDIYEIAPHCKSFTPIIDAFVESLIWRKKETIGKNHIDYVNDYVLKRPHNRFWETVLSVASIPNHFFNADFLHRNLMRYSLPERDAWWATYIHNKMYEPTPVKRLIDWAWSDEDKRHIADESILLSAKAISWFLTSSDRFLRDSATKALIALLENRIEVLQQLLKEFEEVNDPYVYERLFGVAYGCALRTADTGGLKNLSEYIYQTIFDKENVYPHVLLRDYARGVIEYSICSNCGVIVDKEKITPPYKSSWFDAIPTDENIKKYELDYKSPSFKDYYWGQNDIIYSMQPEGSKMHMYGDFGRYVFQSGFSNWDVDVRQLSNLAIKRVFELGYDVEKHGEFDRNINRNFYYGRAGGKPERIGKKYQWIAFYELLARVSDNFVMYDCIWSKDEKKVRFEGPWEPYVRDIDPTILIKSKTQGESHQVDKWWFNAQYENWSLPYEKWVKKTNDLPDPAKIMQVTDCYKNRWLVLEIYPDWEEPIGLGIDKFEHPHKYLWYQIKSYIVKEKDYAKIVPWCREQHFMGCWMPESRDMYQLFSREYYWSPAYRFFQNPYWGGETWCAIPDRKNNREVGKVMVTAERYLWEEEYDCSKDDTISFFRPTQVLFEGLGMRFGPKEGELLDKEGQLICFDPSVSYGSPTCLLVRKDSFNSFLKKNNFKIFWTMLGEKLVHGVGSRGEYSSDRLEFSGVYTFDGERVDGNLKFFSEKR
jgi:hypothetical protein